MAKADLTAQRLRELVHYDPQTGSFTRLQARCTVAQAGTVAGYAAAEGYRRFMVDRKTYLLHRLAWLYTYGEWPKYQIDHINGIRDDNRLCNLRDATPSINRQNMRAVKPERINSGLMGAFFDSRGGGRWYSAITVNGRRKHIGMFKTPEDAHTAYLEAKRKLHPGCTI
jgi:hypothetical protein